MSQSRGSASVELVFTLPVLVVLALGTFDFGRLFFTTIAVNQAARAGAQYGTITPGNAYDNTGMQAAANHAGRDVSGLSVSSSHDCTCYTTTETTMTCGGTCTGQQ